MTNFKFHLDLERSNFKSNNLQELEPILAEWLVSEGETNFDKKEVNAEDLTDKEREEMYVEEIEGIYIYEDKKVVKFHYYNGWTYIIETV